MSESPRGLLVKEAIRVKSVCKVMAHTMKASVDTAALSHVSREIDVTALQALRQKMMADTNSKISLNTLIMTAVARTLPQHPLLNAELVDKEILVYDTTNLGMAVASPAGLIVVVIPDAHALTLAEMNSAIHDLAEKARNGTLARTDVEGGTFTVSNLGMYGIDSGFPLPRPPEGAIVLVGEAKAKPVVVEGEVVIRELARFNLTFDHRFIDGAAAAAFLLDLNKLIAEPEQLSD